MARLAVKKEVLRKLAIASKNQCAFPGCDHPLLNQEGDYIAELCHIEAAKPKGPRFNATHSDEDRRSYENLLFLCHWHHTETHDEEKYPVSRLRQMKLDHEQLPEVVFNHDLLLTRVEEVAEEQARISKLLRNQSGDSHLFPILQSNTPTSIHHGHRSKGGSTRRAVRVTLGSSS